MSNGDTAIAPQGDALVIFGITGDLWRRSMTFRSLYRLEQRNMLDCPIVGVAVEDWTLSDLVDRARTSILGTGETIDEEVFDRFAGRLSYVQGDLTDDATYEHVARAVGSASCPVFYLEVPPFLFGTVVKGLAAVGLTALGRVVVEKPFGHDLASASSLAAELHEYLDESQLYRIDHYLGKMGLEEILYLGLPTPCWSRSGTAITCECVADHVGGGLRCRRPVAISTIRSVPCAMLWSTICSSCWRPPPWRPVARRS